MEHVLEHIGPVTPLAAIMGGVGWLMGKSEKFDFGEVQGLIVGIVAGLVVSALIGIALS